MLLVLDFTFSLSNDIIESEKVGEKMDKNKVLDKLLDDGNGYLLTSQAIDHGISKWQFGEYVKKRNLEKVAQGVYMSEDAWSDELYLIHLRNHKMFFSQETALYLHGLMEREPRYVCVTVKAGYNATHLRERGIKVYQSKPDIYEMGASTVETIYGNRVAVYDMERTICDIIRDKSGMDIQVFQTAMKDYMGNPKKNLTNLMVYASKMKLEEKVRTYVEVML
jgi:predicted transcriptional regulator of viral defense system